MHTGVTGQIRKTAVGRWCCSTSIRARISRIEAVLDAGLRPVYSFLLSYASGLHRAHVRPQNRRAEWLASGSVHFTTDRTFHCFI
jgi:hypothetical protein